MVAGVNPEVQLHKVVSAQHDDASSEFFHIAEQFLANTPVPKTRETYGRELGFFAYWYGKGGSIASITFEDLLRYKVMLERQYSPQR